MRKVFLPAMAAAIALSAAACSAEPEPDATATAEAGTMDDGASDTTGASPEPSANDTAVPGDTPTSSTPSASPSASASATPTASGTAATECASDRAARYIGRTATPTLRAEVIETVGHSRIRWITPGSAVTMDFSPNRLNMRLDANNRITAAECG